MVPEAARAIYSRIIDAQEKMRTATVDSLTKGRERDKAERALRWEMRSIASGGAVCSNPRIRAGLPLACISRGDAERGAARMKSMSELSQRRSPSCCRLALPC